MVDVPLIVVIIVAAILILAGLAIATVLLLLAGMVEDRAYNKTKTISFREEKHGRT